MCSLRRAWALDLYSPVCLRPTFKTWPFLIRQIFRPAWPLTSTASFVLLLLLRQPVSLMLSLTNFTFSICKARPFGVSVHWGETLEQDRIWRAHRKASTAPRAKSLKDKPPFSWATSVFWLPQLVRERVHLEIISSFEVGTGIGRHIFPQTTKGHVLSWLGKLPIFLSLCPVNTCGVVSVVTLSGDVFHGVFCPTSI